MTLKSSTGSACAACKYQRRRCTPTCVLAPYFPADQSKNFRNVHKLFGVSNIVKLLKILDDSQKAEAMQSIIYQAYIRDRYPVHGCLGVIFHLNYQIWQKEEELHAIQSQLEMFRNQRHLSNLTGEVPSQLELGMAPPSNNNNGLTLFTSPHNNHNPQAYTDNRVPVMPLSQQHSYSNSSNNFGYNTSYLDCKDGVCNSSSWAQHQYIVTSNNTNSLPIMPQLAASQPQPLVIQQDVHDYDEMHLFFDAIDDRQSYIDSKEACESSSEDSIKDTTRSIEHVAENELKSAAARFSLTSVN